MSCQKLSKLDSDRSNGIDEISPLAGRRWKGRLVLSFSLSLTQTLTLLRQRTKNLAVSFVSFRHKNHCFVILVGIESAAGWCVCGGSRSFRGIGHANRVVAIGGLAVLKDAAGIIRAVNAIRSACFTVAADPIKPSSSSPLVRDVATEIVARQSGSSRHDACAKYAWHCWLIDWWTNRKWKNVLTVVLPCRYEDVVSCDAIWLRTVYQLVLVLCISLYFGLDTECSM